MNRLKYAFSINVPHTVLSHIHQRRHSNIRLPRSSRWNPSHPKRSVDARNVDNGRQPRIKSGGSQQRRQKSSTAWAKKAILDKNVLERIQQNRYRSSFQAKKMAKDPCVGKQSRRSIACFDDVQSGETNTAEPGARSYAQIIAMYNETMFSKSAFAVLKDITSSHSVIKKTHRSPFSSGSIGPMKPFHAAGSSLLNQEANFSTETSAKRSSLQKPREDIVEPIGGSETGLERVSSYATIIEKYSNSVNIDTLGWGRCMVPRRHVSTKLSHPSSKLEDARSGEAGARETVECSKKSISDGLTEARAESASEKRQVGQAGCTIKDPERIETIEDDMDAKWKPKERADWVDRVVSAHKKSITGRKLMHTGRKTPEMDGEYVAGQTSTHPDLETDYPPTEMSGRKPTNPISDYIRRGPVNSNAQRGAGQAPSQSSTQSSATVNPRKEPQIELRMTPSHNESVVAINVDELSASAAGAKDHLSVVISSRKNANNAANTDAQPDFGSMQISISEDTVPVKQIEFSINGKPVSELKSIVARADKLDVLSSMDKVEIRIPTKDNNARTTNQYSQQVARVPENPSAILNLHINAKFNAPHVRQPKDVGVKPQSTPPVSRSTPPSQAPVPPRTHNIFSPTKQEHANPDGAVATNVVRLEEQPKDPAENMNRGFSQSVNSGTNQSPRNPPRDATVKNPKGDSTAENRVPSNMIPWWSSEEAFKKIKKKGSGVEGAPNKTEDVVAEPKKPEEVSTSQPKSAVSSNPADSPKTGAPGNDANKPEVAGKSPEVMDLSPVRVTSPQRHVHGKAPTSVKHKSRMTKKVYRSRSVVKATAIPKQSSNTQINSVPPPKVVKYVAVTPRTVDVERRPEAARADEKQRTKVEEETKKLEGDATRSGHKNVQKNSDTLAKGADVERSANRSAGVSANSASESEAAKGRSQHMSGTVGKDPPGESVNGRRMKEILKTMKPIEKRKDGTLIDYGVTVPSRKPSETTLRFRGKNVQVVSRPKSLEPEKVTKRGGPRETKEKPVRKESVNTKRAARQPEVIDPVKISSVKKESLTEPKVLASQSKIVEPVKISSVKKPPEDNVPSQPKSDASERISVVKNLTQPGPSNLPYVPRINSDQAIPKKQSLLAKKFSGKLGDSLPQGSSAREKKSVGTVNAPATSEDKDKGLNSKIKIQNTGDSARSLKPNEPSDKKDTRTIFLKGSEAGSGGSMTFNSQSVAKKSRIHSCPSTRRIIDRKSDKMSPENLDKHFKETGFAPFKGTIRHQPPKGNSAHFSNASEEKQAKPKNDKDESGGGSTDFGNSTVGPAGLKSPRSFMMHTITSMKSVTTAPVMPSIKKECKFHGVNIDNIINEPHCHPYLAVDESERPEKGLLYASWLQRFKNTVDDDKML